MSRKWKKSSVIPHRDTKLYRNLCKTVYTIIPNKTWHGIMHRPDTTHIPHGPYGTPPHTQVPLKPCWEEDGETEKRREKDTQEYPKCSIRGQIKLINSCFRIQRAWSCKRRKERAVVNGVSPWSAGGRVFLLCFSESERFPCPDRSALKRETEQVLVNLNTLWLTGSFS